MINPLPSTLTPYARMARFVSTNAARSAYQAIQDCIFRHEEVELSVYNLVVAQVSHVVILGEPPDTGINDELTRMLADGTATPLPPGLIAQLAERRSRQEGPWLERHPGLLGEPVG